MGLNLTRISEGARAWLPWREFAILQKDSAECLREVREQRDVDAPVIHIWTVKEVDWATFYRLGSAILVRFSRLADFIVDVGEGTIEGYPTPACSAAEFEHLYRNQIVPLVISAAGRSVYHGSAVEIGGRGAVFLGPSGRGKSTLATSFALGGAGLISDDAVHVVASDAGFSLVPEQGGVRLWDDSAQALMSECGAREPALGYTTKHRFAATGVLQKPKHSAALAACFVLDAAHDRLAIEPLPPGDAVLAWLTHSFILDPDNREFLRRHFLHASQLAATVPCFRLSYARRYDVLGEVHAAVTQCVVASATAHAGSNAA